MPVLTPKKFKLGHYRLPSHPSARLEPEFSEGNQDELDDPDDRDPVVIRYDCCSRVGRVTCACLSQVAGTCNPERSSCESSA
jgi:hypothetical protein